MTLQFDQRIEVESLLQETAESLKQRSLPLKVVSRPLIFELEVERLWSRVWEFLAHESEIPNPGDYVIRYIGPYDPIILVRSEDGETRAFMNICRHRGMRICRSEMGNAAAFRCTYHGWAYNNRVQLIGVPAYKEAYGDKLNKEEHGLIPVRIDKYEGLIFGNLDDDAQSLVDYLGLLTQA
jgi:phenylpropionate dioxygenase-like ring-hydroxylating dioxygenase large terminal subunit